MNDEIPYATLRGGACGEPVPHPAHFYGPSIGPHGETYDVNLHCDGESTVHIGGIVVDPSQRQTGDD